uniref:DDHD domain-containing protein n=1 Tax=Strongyloides stercoralis TaxID=6248 RepID=A0A0K0DW07_STRER
MISEVKESPILERKNKKKKVSPLTVHEVRWFYKRNNETKWIPFKGYDSINIELHYRQMFGVPIEEEAKHLLDECSDSIDIIVMDGLYQLDSAFLKVYPIYWKDDDFDICRGIWFTTFDMQPINKDLAERIEKHHLQQFLDQTIPFGPVFSDKDTTKRPLLTSFETPTEEVRWNSVIDICLLYNSKTSKLLRYISWSKAIPLTRGYPDEALFDDGKPDFTDLILVVHGIGQKGYENLIAKNTNQLRELLTPIIEKQYNTCKKKMIMLPIEWRSHLVLDEDMSSHILLSKMSNLRETMNAVALDIMYYQSPLYRTEIVNGVIRQLNFVYRTFIKYNPKFQGNVSIFAHSLGSVIAFDILSKWSPLHIYDEYVTNALMTKIESLEGSDRVRLCNYLDSRQTLFDSVQLEDILDEQEEKLIFNVKTLFCVGSPLGIFLVMRGATPKTFEALNGKVERIINIYHPMDPVAYRLEPIFHENYKFFKPLKLFSYTDEKSHTSSYNSSLELMRDYQRKKLEKLSRNQSPIIEVKPNPNDAFLEGYNSDESSPESSPSGSTNNVSKLKSHHEDGESKKTGSWFSSNKNKCSKVEEKGIDALETLDTTDDLEALINIVPKDVKLKRRIDFQVQRSLMDKSYVGMLRAHFSYWTNPDVVSFIANIMLNDHDEGFGEVIEKVV